MMNLLKQRWQAYNSREQLFLLLGTIAIVLFSGYSLLLSPLYHHLETLKKSLTEQQQLLAWMQAKQPLLNVKQQAITREKISTDELLTRLSQLFTQERFNAQLSAEENGQIKIIFKTISFDRFIDWLTKLDQKIYFKIINLNIQRLDHPGMVDIELELATST
ncbi:MAG: type II secretion system protein M [Legionellales bacterium]|nr:type II secretion system protein M [Legionellales bacterium]